VAVSAAIFGAVFQPARRHLQRFVDQRFYNIQIDYQKTPPPDPFERIKSLPHTRLGEYQNLELIGRGGMGEVYKAVHPTLGEPIAIKLLPAALAADDAFRQRFEREARLIGLLQHPNIIRLIDSGAENGTLYMVMEYISGKDLGAHLREHGRLTPDEARRPLQEIAAALDFAHTQGMVHRDVKPGNIMLEANRAVLMDFGIAKLVGGQTSLTNTAVLGTLDYIAPEQIQASAEVDGRADIYAFGVVVYQTLTGALPFQNHNPGALLMANLLQPPPDPRELAPQLSMSAAFAIQRAMAKHPNERFGTAVELIEAIFE
jgi:serine/threonine-protein kinase